jgi:hypothetical protein
MQPATELVMKNISLEGRSGTSSKGDCQARYPGLGPCSFAEFNGASSLFERLKEDELSVRSEEWKYAIFHPLFTEYLKKQ